MHSHELVKTGYYETYDNILQDSFWQGGRRGLPAENAFELIVYYLTHAHLHKSYALCSCCVASVRYSEIAICVCVCQLI